MKRQVIHLLIIGILFSCNSNSDTKQAPAEIFSPNTEELEQSGFDTYQRSPKEALPIFKQVALEYEESENLKMTGITNLNIANIYDEHVDQIDSALIYAERSLHIWSTMRDSMQMANLFKYIGLLKGKRGQFAEAKSSIRTAIRTYNGLGFEQGIAVSEINLAKTYFREKEYEKSMRYFESSKQFWLQKNEVNRVYTDNIVGIEIHAAMKNDEKVESLIKENHKIEEQTKINNFARAKFIKLLEKLNEEVSR